MSLDTLIADTRTAIADDAAKAQVFAAEGTLIGVTEVDIRTGAHSFKVDEPRSLGGANAAANPVQYALASLGSCQAITYRFWAAQLGVELNSITVRVEGDLDLRGFFGVDDGVRPGFSGVHVEVTVAGPESEERYAELAAAVDEHCPVLDLFKNPVPVSRALVISGYLADNPAGRQYRRSSRARLAAASWPADGRTDRGLVPGISSSQAEVDVVQLATGYGLRVRSIRTGEGAIPFPTPDQVFALGDVSAADLNKGAGAAGRQAPIVAGNIRALITGHGELARYQPPPAGIIVPIGPDGGAGQRPDSADLVTAETVAQLKGRDMMVQRFAELLGLSPW